MQSIVSIVLLSIGMAIGAYLAGSVPLMIPLSQEGVRLVSTFSAGLLVGTALIVIIPEGVETIYDAKADGEPHLIGLSLALGFAFMLLVDTFSAHSHPNGHVHVSNLRDTDEEAIELTVPHTREHPKHEKSFSATLGLIIHCAADGLAMGAASASDGSDLELIVFLAIMLHKAPSAFGLTTFLLAEGQNKRTIRNTLVVFSLSAPVAAILTFISLTMTASVQTQSGALTGLVLLFSGGSFLYVATVHILPEIYVNDGHSQQRLSNIQIGLWLLGLITPFALSFSHDH
ncbi:zinc transporter ZIP9-A-like protein [Gorgonomyces haynaldii]|nr:zinc transporter ZIP9-A-like protein [Gorgonomyces haynaldii]